MLELVVEVPKDDFQGFLERMPEAEKAGLHRVARALQELVERSVGDIRKRRVPTRREVALFEQAKRRSKRKRRITASTAPAWTPTGDLLRSVQASPVQEGPSVVKLTADVPYAEYRHELGVTRMPTSPALGVVRRNPFFADPRKTIEPQAANLFADGWNEVMEQ